MKTKQIAALTFTLIISIIGLNVSAQEADRRSSQSAQFTFAYPLGTNGTDAMYVSNNLSFNLLYGVNGGLDGMELGGIMNFNKGDVSGFQLSGVVNANMEKITEIDFC